MLTPAQIATLLTPYAPPQQEWSVLSAKLFTYLDLILRWNSRTNLTAIRDPEQIVLRHFGESLFAAQHIGPTTSLLDLGSGAGFPGIPIQLVHPALHVTLAESQGKKAAFLHEVVRTLNLPTEVWSQRAESLPATRKFDTVALRAVDNMDAAISEAVRRSTGRIILLTTQSARTHPELESFTRTTYPIPQSTERIVLVAER
jgi:16S rRNA (guanine527-N7)-methyltransferase